MRSLAPRPGGVLLLQHVRTIPIGSPPPCATGDAREHGAIPALFAMCSRIARREVRYNRKQVLLVEIGHDRSHQRTPFADARPTLGVGCAVEREVPVGKTVHVDAKLRATADVIEVRRSNVRWHLLPVNHASARFAHVASKCQSSHARGSHGPRCRCAPFVARSSWPRHAVRVRSRIDSAAGNKVVVDRGGTTARSGAHVTR